MSDKKMLAYVHTGQRFPTKRDVAERVRDFREIAPGFAREAAAQQAARCEQCGVPYCQIHCPLSNNIPDWLKMTAEGRLQEAYELAQATNNFPEICGRICPQDRLCEGNCTLEQAGHGTVTIGAVESFITENAWTEGWVKPRRPAAERAQSIGIVGAGPAGLAAAEELRAAGFAVHVYDRHDRAGGLMAYGIPAFKLEKHVVERRARLLAEAGIAFHLGVEIGRDLSLGALRQKHDAVLLATGVYRPRPLAVPGAGLTGVVAALPFLIAANRRAHGEATPPALDAADKAVVVIGGGDTAMDCVRTAVREGARKVACLYRRDRENMPGSAREVGHAEEEGVEFLWQAQPEACVGDGVTFVEAEAETLDGAGGAVRAVAASRVTLSLPDSSGRRAPVPIPGSRFEVAAELVIAALGFDPEDLALLGAPGLAATRWGTAKISHRTMMTSLDGVFAAGDVVRGASLVVWAIRDGRDAARSIAAWLAARDAAAPPQPLAAD
jgi:glutamate synthase (NADPH/NADH) small chain